MKITLDVILKKTTLKRSQNESEEQFAKRIVQLSFFDMEIEVMENLNYCRNLTTLLLNDNKITRIDGLEGLVNLEKLYLQNNSIEEITGINVGLPKLTTLHLAGNKISVITGLDNLPSLETLFIDNQRTDTHVSFDVDCMKDIAISLKTLTAKGNKIEDILPLAYLSELETLDITDNNITYFEDLQFALSNMISITKLEISRNPVMNKMPPAQFRQQCILAASPSLLELNEKVITDVERRFMKRFDKHRNQLRKQGSVTSITTKEIAPELAIIKGIISKDPKDKVRPHLPPYATQYRDLIMLEISRQQQPNANDDAAIAREN